MASTEGCHARQPKLPLAWLLVLEDRLSRRFLKHSIINVDIPTVESRLSLQAHSLIKVSDLSSSVYFGVSLHLGHLLRAIVAEGPGRRLHPPRLTVKPFLQRANPRKLNHT
jgi:hypothetical protein